MRRDRRPAPTSPDDAGSGGGLARPRGRGRRRDPEPPVDAPPHEEADPYSVARTIVLTRLTAAPRTRAELATTLRDRGTPDDVATAVLDRMVEVGLVDDAEFARTWVRSRQSTRGLSRRALAHELRKKGVSDDDAEAALASVDEHVERAAAEELVARKAKATHGLDREVRTRRLVGMLARKGYSSGVAFSVVNQVLDAEADATRV